MNKFLIIALTTFMLCSCVEYDINEVLLVHDDVSLSHKGKIQYAFDPTKGQMACNAERTLYRYMDDKFNSWIEIRFNSRPGGVGEKVIADIKWKERSSVEELENLEFEIKRTVKDGMVWMWNSKDNIGLIIRDFE